MTRAVVALAAALMVVVGASAAGAQGKDPFRPPPAAGSATGDQVQSDTVGGGAPTPQADPGGGLARTGQDVAAALATGIALVALGGAMTLVDRAVGSPPRGRARRGAAPAG